MKNKMEFATNKMPLCTQGHPKSCVCNECNALKLAAFKIRLSQMGGVTPDNIEQTVPVRAHWRKQRNHLAKNEQLRDDVKKLLAELLSSNKH